MQTLCKPSSSSHFTFLLPVTDQSTASRGVENTERTTNRQAATADTQLAAVRRRRGGIISYVKTSIA